MVWSIRLQEGLAKVGGSAPLVTTGKPDWFPQLRGEKARRVEEAVKGVRTACTVLRDVGQYGGRKVICPTVAPVNLRTPFDKMFTPHRATQQMTW